MRWGNPASSSLFVDSGTRRWREHQGETWKDHQLGVSRGVTKASSVGRAAAGRISKSSIGSRGGLRRIHPPWHPFPRAGCDGPRAPEVNLSPSPPGTIGGASGGPRVARDLVHRDVGNEVPSSRARERESAELGASHLPRPRATRVPLSQGHGTLAFRPGSLLEVGLLAGSDSLEVADHVPRARAPVVEPPGLGVEFDAPSVVPGYGYLRRVRRVKQGATGGDGAGTSAGRLKPASSWAAERGPRNGLPSFRRHQGGVSAPTPGQPRKQRSPCVPRPLLSQETTTIPAPPLS